VIGGLGGATAWVTIDDITVPIFVDLALSKWAIAPGDACCVDGGMSI
jgi:hypothetical protein